MFHSLLLFVMKYNVLCLDPSENLAVRVLTLAAHPSTPAMRSKALLFRACDSSGHRYPCTCPAHPDNSNKPEANSLVISKSNAKQGATRYKNAGPAICCAFFLPVVFALVPARSHLPSSPRCCSYLIALMSAPGSYPCSVHKLDFTDTNGELAQALTRSARGGAFGGHRTHAGECRHSE